MKMDGVKKSVRKYSNACICATLGALNGVTGYGVCMSNIPYRELGYILALWFTVFWGAEGLYQYRRIKKEDK